MNIIPRLRTSWINFSRTKQKYLMYILNDLASFQVQKAI